MRIPIKANIDTYNDIIAEVKQLDDITLELTLYRDGEAFDVTGQTVSLRVGRTDGAIIEQTTMIDINKNVVTIEVKNICFAVAGNVEMELNLVDAKGSISTSTFYIAVDSIILNEETLPESDIGILNEAKELEPVRQKAENVRIANEKERVTNENIRIANENARKNNEISRQQAETNRVDVFNHNENERKNTFDSNENSRKNIFETNEAIRKANEDTRLSNENERKKAETIRLSNENTRANAETGRVSAENKRATDENKRASAEIVRGNSESARLSAETTRNTNESNRVTAENNRVNAESNRVIAENNRQLEVTKAREDYFHNTHEDLYKRLYEDFKKVWLEFQNASLLSYEGNYITANNTLLGNTDSLILKGRTLQNLCCKGVALCNDITKFNHNYPNSTIVTQETEGIKSLSGIDGEYNSLGYDEKNMLKPDTKYITIADVEVIKNEMNIPIIASATGRQQSNLISITNGRGLIVTKNISPSDLTLSNARWISVQFKNMGAKIGDGFKVYSIAVYEVSDIEFNMTVEEILNKFPVKLEGIKSVEGNLSIKSCGKNLFYYKKILRNFPCEIVTEEGKTCLKLTTSKELNNIKLMGRGKPNTQYTMKSCTKRGITELPGGGLSFVVNYTDGAKSYMVGTNQNTFTERIDTTTANKTVESIYCTYASLNIPSFFDINVGQLEENTAPTSYEPYVEDKITVSNLILRSQDALDSKGILTRCMSKLVLNNNENWAVTSAPNQVNTLHLQLSSYSSAIKSNNIICENLLVLYNWDKDIESICVNSLGYIQIRVLKSKLATADLTGFKEWLKLNPITIYYQLATPVTESINFRNLNSYKGITNIITEGTLIQPLISTKIPSNVQGVVSSLQAENTSLNNQVSTLSEENQYLKSNVSNLNDVTNELLINDLK